MTASPSKPTRTAVPRWQAVVGVIGLLGLALVLRSWGLGWGLPGPTRFYPGHPDESVLLLAVCNVNPLWGDFTPTFYNYGSFLILLTRLAYDLTSPLQGWGTVPRAGEFSGWVGDFAHLLSVGRACNVVLGTLGVGLVLWTGKRLYSPRAGWIAALFLAIAPLPVLLGHYLTVDLPATALGLAALAAAAGALDAEPKRFPKWALLCGAAAGLAAGTKYNAGLILAVLAVPCWLQATRREEKVDGTETSGKLRMNWLPWAVGAGVVAAVAFVISTPGVLMETAKFQEDLSYELWRNREGQGLIFKGTPPALLYHLGISLPVGLEWPLFVAGVAGLAWAVKKRRPADALLLLYLAVTFLPLLTAERKFVRYVAPVVPVLCLLAARLLDELLGSRLKPIGWAAGGLAGGLALASTIAHLGVMAGQDSRDAAAEYLRQQAAPNDVVALGADPWYYTPPLDASAGCVKAATPFGGPPVWDRFPDASRPTLYPLPAYQVLAPDSNTAAGGPAGALPVSRLRETRPRFVVLTDYEWEDPMRLKQQNPAYQSGILELMEALKEGYHVEREFRPRPSLAGFTWWRTGIPPHDWRYAMPTVRLYSRNP